MAAGAFQWHADEIRFSANEINDRFGTDNKPEIDVHELVVDLLRGKRHIDELPVMAVVVHEARWYSLNNRLLYAVKQYEKILNHLELDPPRLKIKCKVGEAAEPIATDGRTVELQRPISIQYGTSVRLAGVCGPITISDGSDSWQLPALPRDPSPVHSKAKATSGGLTPLPQRQQEV